MSRRINLPDVLIMIGAVIGGTLGWYFGHLLGLFMAAHVAIIVGFALRPTIRRLGMAAGFAFLMWWPVWLGQRFWD